MSPAETILANVNSREESRRTLSATTGEHVNKLPVHMLDDRTGWKPAYPLLFFAISCRSACCEQQLSRISQSQCLHHRGFPRRDSLRSPSLKQ